MLRRGITKNHANDFDAVAWRVLRHPLQAGRHFVEVHRKQPLDNHGPEKVGRKRPNRSNLVPNCAAHGGCFVRGKAREMGVVHDTCQPGEKVCGLAGGRFGIRTRSGDSPGATCHWAMEVSTAPDLRNAMIRRPT